MLWGTWLGELQQSLCKRGSWRASLQLFLLKLFLLSSLTCHVSVSLLGLFIVIDDNAIFRNCSSGDGCRVFATSCYCLFPLFAATIHRRNLCDCQGLLLPL